MYHRRYPKRHEIRVPDLRRELEAISYPCYKGHENLLVCTQDCAVRPEVAVSPEEFTLEERLLPSDYWIG
jgi:hypothetical protein